VLPDAEAVGGSWATVQGTEPQFRPYFLNHNLSLRGHNARLSDVLDDINANSGNSYICFALCRLLGLRAPPDGIANLFTARHVDVDAINHSHTHVLLALQDHIGPSRNGLDWERLTGIIEQIRIPLIVFSLGVCGVGSTPRNVAATLEPAAIRFFRVLGEKAVSIGVGGSLTAETLDALGIANYAVVGCPSYFEAGPGRRIAKNNAVVDSARIAAMGLFSNRNTAHATFLLQSERALLHALYDVSPLSPDSVREIVTAGPAYRDYVVAAIRARRIHFSPNVSRWKGFLRGRFDLGIGTRLHGAMMCLNVGIPVVVTARDMRAQEMCSLFGVSHYPGYDLYDHSVDELVDMAQVYQVNRRYDGLYNGFMQWLGNCGLPMGRHCLADFLEWPWTTLEPVSQPSADKRVRNALRQFASPV
jgi:hypothetical protein